MHSQVRFRIVFLLVGRVSCGLGGGVSLVGVRNCCAWGLILLLSGTEFTLSFRSAARFVVVRVGYVGVERFRPRLKVLPSGNINFSKQIIHFLHRGLGWLRLELWGLYLFVSLIWPKVAFLFCPSCMVHV